MDKEDKNSQEFEGNLVGLVKLLVKERNKCITDLEDMKRRRKKGIPIDRELEDLKSNLNFLLFNYWPKLEYTDKVEIDNSLKKKIEKDGLEPNADNLEFDECRTLLYKINELMEHLGHTKIETEQIGRRKT